MVQAAEAQQMVQAGAGLRGAPRFQVPQAKGPGPGRGHFSIAGEARCKRNERLAEEMCEFAIAQDAAAPPMVRVHAAERLLNRIEGPPIRCEADTTNDRIVIEGGLPARTQP